MRRMPVRAGVAGGSRPKRYGNMSPAAQRGASTLGATSGISSGPTRAKHDSGGSESVAQPLVIGPGSWRLEVHFMALHFARPARVQYRYQLEGYDNGWVECGNRREAYYQRIPPGEGTALTFEIPIPDGRSDRRLSE